MNTKRFLFLILFAVAWMWPVGAVLAQHACIEGEPCVEHETILPIGMVPFPPGVQFSMETDENGQSVLATIVVENATPSSIHFTLMGGTIVMDNPKIYSDTGTGTSYELPSGEHWVPAHSRIILAHVSMPMMPPVPVNDIQAADSSAQALSILPVADRVVRAKLAVIPISDSPIVAQPAADGILANTDSTATQAGDVQCLGYPVCYDRPGPITIVVEDSIQMDYRSLQINSILNGLQTVNSNVASTQAKLTGLDGYIRDQIRTILNQIISMLNIIMDRLKVRLPVPTQTFKPLPTLAMASIQRPLEAR